ncbi:MAG: hypothetical protein SGJ19_27055, partial [Planctomycetia bacterium]|nr:hypothetical protein [Planctomycetia bacterium]
MNSAAFAAWKSLVLDEIFEAFAASEKLERALIFKGSSPNSGESLADFEKEVVVVSVAVGHTFEDFD